MTMTETPLERAVFLLGEAAGAAEPDTYRCCTEDDMCGSHGQAMDAAELVARIRDAARNAANADEAGRAIAEILRGEGRRCVRIGGCLAEIGAHAMADNPRVPENIWRCGCGRTPKDIAKTAETAVTGGMKK